jgi:hypothetical protein
VSGAGLRRLGRALVPAMIGFVCLGILAGGVRSLLDGNLGGVIGIAFGLLSLAIVGLEIRAALARPEAQPVARAGARGAMHVAGIVFATFGFAGFLSAVFLGVDAAASLAEHELPLGRTEGIAVDPTGRIYVGSPDYRRVARYEPDGRFDRGWHAPVPRGAWRLAIGADGALRLDVAGHLHALDGDVEMRDLGEPAPADLAWNVREATGADGSRYELRRHPARVVRHAPTGGERTIIAQPWLAIALGAPLPAFAFATFGLFLLLLSDARVDARAARRAGTA